MEPKRGRIIREVFVGSQTISRDTQVWILSEGASDVRIEYHGRRARVPFDAVIASPVRQPTLAELQDLDGCFGSGPEAFEVEHSDTERYFSIERCRAHGRRFLRDVRGDIALYGRLTLLEDSDVGATPIDVWSKYHQMSNDWLNLLSRSM